MVMEENFTPESALVSWLSYRTSVFIAGIQVLSCDGVPNTKNKNIPTKQAANNAQIGLGINGL